MAHLEIRELNKRFGDFAALAHINLTVEKGEFLVLLGPSGCGKTTLLRTIAGLESPDSGQIIHAGHDISNLPPAQRDYGIVFQSYALFPNLTVGKNVAYGLSPSRHGKEFMARRVDEMLTLVGLPGSHNKYPAELSGGQQQRIALARALATAPDLLLLDEPLSALDAIERVRLRSEIRSLQQRLGVTTIMVTHDQEEALSMADRIVVMRHGHIQQTGSPQAIYQRPENPFVADFIGRANLIEGIANTADSVDFGGLRLRHQGQIAVGESTRFYVRPEDIRLCNTLDNGPNHFYAQVRESEFLGAYSLFTLDIPATPGLQLQAQFATNYLAGRQILPGAIIRIAIPPALLQAIPGVAQ